jgi:hypothetical protein
VLIMADIKHTPEQMNAVRDAIAAALGDTYDCTRVWSAWGVGTMGPDDFVPVAEDDERMHELTIAALDAAASVEMPAPSNAALELMELQGGSFIKALAHCYLMADPDNKRRLRLAMSDWFASYEARAKALEI